MCCNLFPAPSAADVAAEAAGHAACYSGSLLFLSSPPEQLEGCLCFCLPLLLLVTPCCCCCCGCLLFLLLLPLLPCAFAAAVWPTRAHSPLHPHQHPLGHHLAEPHHHLLLLL